MSNHVLARTTSILAFAGLVAAGCGGSASLADPTTTPTATPSATSAATTAASAGAWTVSDKSKATVRVREQLVGVSLPSDAVLTATGATGSFELKGDGTFASASKIGFDLTTLSSDERNRDNFIKQDTLQVRQFPKAEFVPTKVTGLSLPLATSGTFTFTLTGNMTIRGATKEVTFDVVAKRDRSDLTATATANPSWKFGDFGMTAPSVPFRVVSVTDEIRVAIDLVATGPKG
ncbi:MAG TPA: YceI family protein [Candidatus Limnocylindria bacterium]|nr:YceI family protein [Candidatus Limnocylindria bacterium]